MDTTSSKNTAFADVPFDALASNLQGSLIRRHDAEYDSARAVYNGMINRYPAAIARCADADDVVTCVRFAREHGIDLAVRGGGHGAAGLCVGDDALVIDLSTMRDIAVDAARREVVVGGGCTWGEVDRATVAEGMATPSGFVSSTGVGGLALGGGVGYLTRRFGLTVDNLLSADVVLADGRKVVADAESHPALFWALRGGSGNFGVVTSFRFTCHEIGDNGVIFGGPVLYDEADLPDVMHWYREMLPGLPEELNGWIGIMAVPPAPPFPEELWGRHVCGIVWCYTGPLDRAEEVTAPVREFGSPLVVGMQQMPFDVLQSAFDGLLPAGLQWYWRADYFDEITDEAIRVHQKYLAALPTGHSTMHLYPIGGAAARVSESETAFPHRGQGWTGTIVGIDPDPANAQRITDWTKAYWEELHPTATGAVYVNFLMEEGRDRVRDAYGSNYERLTRIKAEYDPENVFHLNQNIRPAGS